VEWLEDETNVLRGCWSRGNSSATSGRHVLTASGDRNAPPDRWAEPRII